MIKAYQPSGNWSLLEISRRNYYEDERFQLPHGDHNVGRIYIPDTLTSQQVQSSFATAGRVVSNSIQTRLIGGFSIHLGLSFHLTTMRAD